MAVARERCDRAVRIDAAHAVVARVRNEEDPVRIRG